MGTAITGHSCFSFIFRLGPCRLLSLCLNQKDSSDRETFTYVNATDVKWVRAQRLVLLLLWESRFRSYRRHFPTSWSNYLRIFHLFRLFSSMRDRIRMAVFYSFVFYWPAKKMSGVYVRVFAGLELNSFFLLVLISSNNDNASTVKILVGREGAITFGFFFKLKFATDFKRENQIELIGKDSGGSMKSDSAWIQHFPTASTVLNQLDVRIWGWRNYCRAHLVFPFAPSPPRSHHIRKWFVM